MNRSLFKFLILAVFGTGVAIGFLLPNTASATNYTYYFWDYPGTASSATHTTPSIQGSPPYIWSGLYPTSTSFAVGSSVNNDCGTFPIHLHQERGSGNWAKNSYFPTRAGCDDDNGCKTDGVWDQYHSERIWYSSGY